MIGALIPTPTNPPAKQVASSRTVTAHSATTTPKNQLQRALAARTN